MSNNYKYTSINRILSKLRRDLNMDDEIHETDVIEWAGEALEAIDAINQYESALAVIEVKNFTACIPNGSQTIIQLAKNNCWAGPQDDSLCAKQVVEMTETTEEESPICPIVLDCNGQPLQDYELAYYRPYFDLQAEAPFVNSLCNANQSCYTPIRKASHTMFEGVAMDSLDNKGDLYQPHKFDEYQVINKGRAIRFSFAEGQILLAYTRICLDDEGYPMIPDHYSYTTAITKYVTYKLMERRFYRNERGSESRLQKAEQDWHWYCKQAGNHALMLKGEDDHQDLLEQRLHLLPKLKRYYGFFGKMNKAEGRKFNDPDNRNNYNYFRGYSDVY